MMSSHLLSKLIKAFKLPLPAELAHSRMEASSAAYLSVGPDRETRLSAVLILLYPADGELCLPLIQRAPYDGVHSAQIAFPGGRWEPEDADLIQTALRETREEIGVNTDEIIILGTLTEIFIAPSNFKVLPVVGYLPYRPVFSADEREVAAIMETSLAHFNLPAVRGVAKITIPDDLVTTPYYDLNGHQVWGATAKMISELLLMASL